MGRSRLQLSEILNLFTPYVYFQPPTGTQMEYPCIVYQLDDVSVQFADNSAYRSHDGYQLTVIDRDPDSWLNSVVKELPLCRFDRAYPANNLNHFVYNLFF